MIWKINPNRKHPAQFDEKGDLGNFCIQISHPKKFGPMGDRVHDQSVEWALLHVDPSDTLAQHPVVWARGVARNPEQAKTEAMRSAMIHLQRVMKKEEKTARPLIQVARQFLKDRPKP